MNAACIIAACAASARRNSAGNSYVGAGESKGFEVYYNVKLRKYYYFEDMTLVSYEGDYFTGSIYAPVVTRFVKPVKIPAKTIAMEQRFSISASKCPNGIDEYIRANLDDINSSIVWRENDSTVIDKYINELNKSLNIKLDPASLKYTSQFYWEVC